MAVNAYIPNQEEIIARLAADSSESAGISSGSSITAYISGSETIVATTPVIPAEEAGITDYIYIKGADGVGIPSGGTTGQVLKKHSNSDYDTEWGDAGGGGSTDYDDLTDKPSINSVVLQGNKTLAELGIAPKNIWYGECSTDASTQIKLVSIYGTTPFGYQTGDVLFVRFSRKNEALNPKIQILGDAPRSITGITGYAGDASLWETGEVVGFVFNDNIQFFFYIGKSVASTSNYGLALLSSSTSSTSDTMAATPSAVKAAYDLASSKVGLTGDETVHGEKTFTSQPLLSTKYDNRYQQVEYLQGSGTQYINTGKPVHMGWRYRLVYQQTDTGQYRIWGAFNQQAYNGGFNASLTYSNGWTFRWETVSGQTREVQLSTINADKHTAEIINGDAYFDGVYRGISAGHSASAVSNYNAFLFTINPGGTTPTTIMKGKVYSYKVWDDSGKLVQDLIPARDTENSVNGMYDRVSGSFLTNAGSGTFTVGNDVTTASPIETADTLEKVATTGLYSDLSGRPALAAVATSGSYNDLSSKPTIPSASSSAPKAPGTAAAGTSAYYSRADHVHPAQTVPSPSDATPQTPGTAAAGTSADYSRADHVHPAQTVPSASDATPQALGTAAAGSSSDYSRADHVHTKPTYTAANVGAVPGSGTTFYSGNQSNCEHNANNMVKNGCYYIGSNANGPPTSLGVQNADSAVHVQAYSDAWVVQLAQDYRDGQIFVRAKKNGTWQSWMAVPMFTTTDGSKGSATQPLYIDANGCLLPTTYTLEKSVPSDAVFTDTTYESKTAVSGGTDVSLVTTGEKYVWNNKTELFIVTVTLNSSYVNVADKTFAEITAAYNAGKQVICLRDTYVLPLTSITAASIYFGAFINGTCCLLSISSTNSVSVDYRSVPQYPVTYTQNSNVSVAGTSKTTYTYGQGAIYTPNGIIIGGTAAAAGLVTRGVCGIQSPNSNGACNKDNLFLNYDGDNTYRSNRQVVIQAGATGTHYGSNLYQYCAARGDAVKGYIDSRAADLSMLPTPTAADEGKIPRIVGGAWTLASLPSASGNSF